MSIKRCLVCLFLSVLFHFLEKYPTKPIPNSEDPDQMPCFACLPMSYLWDAKNRTEENRMQ